MKLNAALTARTCGQTPYTHVLSCGTQKPDIKMPRLHTVAKYMDYGEKWIFGLITSRRNSVHRLAPGRHPEVALMDSLMQYAPVAKRDADALGWQPGQAGGHA